MSEPVDQLPEDEAFAAEHALGVLNAADRREAETRMAREPAFAAMVEAWTARLAPMLDAITPVAPAAALWPRIDRALPANDNSVVFWRRWAMGSTAAAVACAVGLAVFANRPPVVVQPPEPGAVERAPGHLGRPAPVRGGL